MKKFISLIFMLLLTISVHAQTLNGNWLMVKVETADKKIDEPYAVTNFMKNGEFTIMDMPFGKWKYNEKTNTINLTSKRKSFNGTAKIITFNNTYLKFKLNGDTFSYVKMDLNQIQKGNAASPLIGAWTFKDNGMSHSVKFNTPNTFVAITTGDGSTSTANGEWIYSPTDNSVIMTGYFREIRGKSIIKTATAEKLVLVNNGKTITAEKANTTNSKNERLTFSYDDLPEDSAQAGALPWTDFYAMLEYLSGVKELTFKQGTLLEKTGTYTYNTVLARIITNPKKEKITVNNIFVENGHEEQFSQMHKGYLMNQYNDFYPRNEISPYRVIGTQSVTVPAGTFDCTVVEGFQDEDKVKLWMINDKPGIYAKVITEGKGHFGGLKYIVLELETILSR